MIQFCATGQPLICHPLLPLVQSFCTMNALAPLAPGLLGPLPPHQSSSSQHGDSLCLWLLAWTMLPSRLHLHPMIRLCNCSNAGRASGFGRAEVQWPTWGG